MIVDLKVHVEIVNYKGRQGSDMRPRESFFLDFAIFLRMILTCHETLAKDKRGVRARFAEVFCFIRKKWPFADKGI